jgi:hypothetical protein
MRRWCFSRYPNGRICFTGVWRRKGREALALVNAKFKFALEHAIKSQRKGRCIYLYSFFNLACRWGWVVKATPQPLYPWKRDPVPIVHEAGWAPGPVWMSAKSFALTGVRSPDRPGLSESLHRLRYPGPHWRRKRMLEGKLNHITGGEKNGDSLVAFSWTSTVSLTRYRCSGSGFAMKEGMKAMEV